MKKWNTLSKLKIQSFGKTQDKSTKFKINDLIKVLLENRGIKTKKQIQEFLNPKLENITAESLGIDKKELQKGVERIKKAIDLKEKVVIFGDYDADGVCATAVLWESLSSLGADVMPYIPHRIDEGYGLSIKGIKNVILNLFQDLSKKEIPNLVRNDRNDKGGLIITVDNGIVANEAVDFANKEGIDVIITDHHIPGKTLPKAFAIVHSTKVCGAGVAWVLAQELKTKNLKLKEDNIEKHLELVAIATIADLVPLKDANRTLVKIGLEKIKTTKRVGLKALFDEARFEQSKIGVYELGHVIAPRINAMGRLDYAMDSLRLLCTKNSARAKTLAEKLGTTNRERQSLTEETLNHAFSEIKNSSVREAQDKKGKTQKILFIGHETYQQGVIGLVAGKLVEEYYRPSFVFSYGKIYSKASARSVKGFNIIEFIRKHSEFLVDCGGHPMAAGFTVETAKIPLLRKSFEEMAEKLINNTILKRTLRVDMELPFSFIDIELHDEIQKLEPFGMGNPEPVFSSKNVAVEDMRLVGADGKHLKLKLKAKSEKRKTEPTTYNLQPITYLNGICFGMGERSKDLHVGDKIDIAYVLEVNEWNGNRKIELKIKDFRV